MPVSKQELEQILHLTFPNAIIELTDLAGDEDHYKLDIIDEQFRGMSVLNKHRTVKAALASVLEQRLHAITINAKAE